MNALLLKLSEVPGLDPVGLVLTREWPSGEYDRNGYTCIGLRDGDRLAARDEDGNGWAEPRSVCRVSLADSATRDRVERWDRLRSLLGAAPEQRVIFAGLRERSGPVALFHLLDARGPVSVSIRVPALAEIDPAAPDADWLALAAVCRAVGSAS